MNKKSKRDKDRDGLVEEWYTSLLPEDKLYVDEKRKLVAPCVHGRHQELELVFAMILFAVNEPRCARC